VRSQFWLIKQVTSRLQSINHTSASNSKLLTRRKPAATRCNSETSETTKQTTREEAKEAKGKSKTVWRKRDGKRVKDKSDGVRSLRKIKRRLFLDAVKSAPRQHPNPNVPGKKKSNQ
jgi:hypothetical protein